MLKLSDYYKKYSKSTHGEENQFNKALYETKIVQGIFERINNLEDRIKLLEEEKDNKK